MNIYQDLYDKVRRWKKMPAPDTDRPDILELPGSAPWLYRPGRSCGDPVEWVAAEANMPSTEAAALLRRTVPELSAAEIESWEVGRTRRNLLSILLSEGQTTLRDTSDPKILALLDKSRLSSASKVAHLDLKRLRAITTSTQISLRAYSKHIAVPCYDLPGRLSGVLLLTEPPKGDQKLTETFVRLPEAQATFVGKLTGAGSLILVCGPGLTVLQMVDRTHRSSSNFGSRLVQWSADLEGTYPNLSEVVRTLGAGGSTVIVTTGFSPVYRLARELSGKGAKIVTLVPEQLEYEKLHSKTPSERVYEWLEKAEPWDQALEDALSDSPWSDNSVKFLKSIFGDDRVAMDRFVFNCSPSLKRKISEDATNHRSARWRNVEIRMDEYGWHYKKETLCNLDWWVDTVLQFGDRTIYDVVVRNNERTWNFTATDKQLDKYPLATIRESILSQGGPLFVFEAGMQRSALRLAMQSRPPRTMYMPKQAGWDERDGSIFFPRFRLRRDRVEVLPDEVFKLGSGYFGRDIRPPYPICGEEIRCLDTERKSSKLFWVAVAQAVTHIVAPVTLHPFLPLRTACRKTLSRMEQLEDILGWSPSKVKGMNPIPGLCGVANGSNHWLKSSDEPYYNFSWDALANILVSYLENFVKRRGFWLSSGGGRFRVLGDIALWWKSVGGDSQKVLDARSAVVWSFAVDGPSKALEQVLHIQARALGKESLSELGRVHSFLESRKGRLNAKASTELETIWSKKFGKK